MGNQRCSLLRVPREDDFLPSFPTLKPYTHAWYTHIHTQCSPNSEPLFAECPASATYNTLCKLSVLSSNHHDHIGTCYCIDASFHLWPTVSHSSASI